jgi:hypothetical protein
MEKESEKVFRIANELEEEGLVPGWGTVEEVVRDHLSGELRMTDLTRRYECQPGRAYRIMRALKSVPVM